MVVTFTVATTTTTAVAAASTATMTHVSNQVLDFLSCGIAILKHLTLKLQCLACQGMVGVECNTVGLHLGHLSHKMLALFVLHGDDGTFIDVSAIKLTIDFKLLAAQFVNTLFIVFTKGLCRCQGEVEVLSLSQLCNLLLKAVEREAEACDKLEGALLLGFLNQLLLAIAVDGVELIVNADVLVLLIIHFSLFFL